MAGQKSLHLIKADMKGEKGKTLILINSDFKKIIGDWEMLYTIKMYMSDNLMSTSIVKSVEINKGLSDDLFSPEKIEVSPMQEMMKMQKEGEAEK